MKKSHISKIVVCLMLVFLPSHSAHADIGQIIEYIIQQIGNNRYAAIVTATATRQGKVYVDGDPITSSTTGAAESAASKTTSYPGEQTVTFNIKSFPNPGYKVEWGWDEPDSRIVSHSTTDEGRTLLFGVKTSNVTGGGNAYRYNVSANFTLIQYNIYYEPGDHGSGSMSQSPYTIESAPSISQCTFTPGSGYIFDKWKVTSSTAGGWTNGDLLSGGQTLSAGRYGNVTLTAQWAVVPTADITIEVTGLKEGESAIFTVTKVKPETHLYTVSITGNSSGTSSVTIKSLETGFNYKVSPINAWTWTYDMDPNGGMVIGLGSSGATFEFEATKKSSAKKHDEKSNVNWRP